MSVAERETMWPSEVQVVPGLVAEWLAAQSLQPRRRGDVTAAQLLPDRSVLCVVVRPAAHRGRCIRMQFLRVCDLAALARRRGDWLRPRPVLVLPLPADQVLVKDLNLPTEDLAELQLMLAHEVETLSPYGVDQTEYSFARLGSPQADHTAVRCFLVERSAVASLCEPFAGTGIAVCGIVPSCLASLAGLQALSLWRPDRLFVLCDGAVAECLFGRSDGTWLSRVGLLGESAQRADDMVREVLTSLSVFQVQPVEPESRLRVHIGGLSAPQIQELADQIRQVPASPPVDVLAIGSECVAGLPEDLLVPAIRLAGAAQRQMCGGADGERGHLIPQSYRDSHRRRQALTRDARWLGTCLLVAILGSAALAAGNWRMQRLGDRIEASIAPHLGLASQVAAKRDQLVAARRQLDSRDMPLRILSGLAEVTPNGVFLYKLGVSSQNVVTIDGVADSLHLAFEFPEYLRKSPLFTQIQLNYAQQSKSGEQAVVEFRCTCRLQGESGQRGRQ